MPYIPEAGRFTSEVVGPMGPKDAKIVLVGEAPGKTEVVEGRPFVGTSGKLLSYLLATAGINRANCYITNVLKFRPPADNIKPYVNTSAVPVKYSDEYLLCEDVLKEELRELNPNVIVAVGATALWALCRLTGITKYRGSILESTLLPGVKVVPTIHPSAALRQFLFRHFILQDLRKANEQAKFPEIPRVEYDIAMRPTLVETIGYLEKAATLPMVAFDIELVRDEVDCFSIAVSGQEAICVPIVDDNGNPYFCQYDEAKVWKALAAVLENHETKIIIQNSPFDFSVMYAHYGIRVRNHEDTMIAQAIITPDFPKGLDFLTSVYTNQPYYKDDGKKWYKEPGGDKRVFWRYNALDSLVCMDIFPQQLRDLQSLGNMETYEVHRDIVPALVYMNYRGIRMDTEKMKELAAQAELDIAKLEGMFRERAGDVNLASPKQMAEYFYGKLGHRPYIKRGTGKPTTDESALRKLARKGCYEAELLTEHRRISKIKGTYLEMKLDADGRLRCSFNPVGAITGRLSSSQTIFGTGGNMQNQPPVMKKLQLVDEGCVAYSFDIAGAENRVVAFFGPVPAMREAFTRGLDVHKLTAAAIFGIPVLGQEGEPCI